MTTVCAFSAAAKVPGGPSKLDRSDPSQQHERTPLDPDLGAGRDDACRRGRIGCDLDLPARTEASRRQGERDRIAVGVEEQQERVVDDLLPVRCPVRDLEPVEKDTERMRVLPLPVLLRHAPAVRPEPPDVRQTRPAYLTSREERRAPEYRMLLSQPDESLRELQ